MFPVTLEFKSGEVSTLHPPCYGFLRDEEYNEDSHTYAEGSWIFSYRAWSRGGDPFGSNISHTGEENGVCRTSCNMFLLEDLKTIWNSGSHYPIHGENSDGKVVAYQYTGYPTIHSSEEPNRPSNLVEEWSEEFGIKVTTKDVMEKFEQWLDKDSESCLRWHEDGFMGVSADVPCDRALFYLMLNRALFAKDEKNEIYQLLDGIYIRNLPPMVAFLQGKICLRATDGVSKGNMFGTVSTDDGCIFPSTLLWVGMGKQYAQPKQVEWLQKPYTSGEGHKRDEDLECLYFETGTFEEHFNQSLFQALMGAELATVNGTDNVPIDPVTKKPVMNLVCEFARQVLSEGQLNYLLGRSRSSGDYPDYWRCESEINHAEVHHLKVGKDDWIQLSLKLLMDE